MPRLFTAKPDPKLVNDLIKVLDKYIDKNPEGYASVMLASISAAFHVVWKLLPMPAKRRVKSNTGYTITATLPKVQLGKVSA